MFERGGANYVVYWHTFGEGTLELDIPAAELEIRDELWAEPLDIGGGIPVGHRRYIKTTLPEDAIIEALRNARLTTEA